MAPERPEKCHLYGSSFVNYMERLMWFRDHEDKGHETPYAYETQMQYLLRIREVYSEKDIYFIRYENPSYDLFRVFTDADKRSLWYGNTDKEHECVMNEQSSSRPKVPLWKALSGVEESMVWQYCQEDFKTFKYKRLSREAGGERCW